MEPPQPASTIPTRPLIHNWAAFDRGLEVFTIDIVLRFWILVTDRSNSLVSDRTPTVDQIADRNRSLRREHDSAYREIAGNYADSPGL